MSAPQYCDVDQLADRLGIEHDDPRATALSQAVGAASRWVELQTTRRFYAVDETRYYTAGWRGVSGYGASQHIAIDDFISVSAVATDDDGNGTYETVWAAGVDYWLGPRNAALDGKPYRSINRNRVTGHYSFPLWDNGISVTGSVGFSATVPDDIRELTLYVATLFAQSVAQSLVIPGVQSYSIGNELSVTMSKSAEPSLSRGDLPLQMQHIIDEYRELVFA